MPELAIVHTEVLGAILAPVLLRRRIRYTVVMHGEDTNPRILASPGRRRAVSRALVGAAAVSVVGRTLMPHLQRVAPQALGVVVENGYDPEVDEIEAVAAPFSRDGVPRLSCVANLQEEKGHAELLDAMRLLIERGRDLSLDLVGEGPLEGRLRTQASRNGLDHHVTFHGALPPSRAAEVIARSDAFVLPSRREALGIVYLNAMALGRPVIGVQGTGIDGVVDHAQTGYLLANGGPEAIAGAIAGLIDRPEESRAVAAAGRVEARRRSWRENARRTIEILQGKVAIA